MDECKDNSCKQRAEYLHRSLIIVHTQCTQWQTAFIQEKSVSSLKLNRAGFTGYFQILRHPGKTEHATNSVYQALFSPPTRESLGMRLILLITYFTSCTPRWFICTIWNCDHVLKTLCITISGTLRPGSIIFV